MIKITKPSEWSIFKPDVFNQDDYKSRLQIDEKIASLQKRIGFFELIQTAALFCLNLAGSSILSEFVFGFDEMSMALRLTAYAVAFVALSMHRACARAIDRKNDYISELRALDNKMFLSSAC